MKWLVRWTEALRWISVPDLYLCNILLSAVVAVLTVILSIATFLLIEVRFRPSLYAVDARRPSFVAVAPVAIALPDTPAEQVFS